MTIVTEKFINHAKIAGLRFHFVMPHLTWHHNFNLKEFEEIYQQIFTWVRELKSFNNCCSLSSSHRTSDSFPRVEGPGSSDSVLSPCAVLLLVSKSLNSNDDEACKLGVNWPHSLYKLLHIVIKWPWRSFFSHWAATIRPGQYNIITSHNNNPIQNHWQRHRLTARQLHHTTERTGE